MNSFLRVAPIHFSTADFARIGLGICYDVRFPEMAMIAARQGSVRLWSTELCSCRLIGCHVLIYPGAFNLTTGPLHWELLQRSRFVWSYQLEDSNLPPPRAIDNQVFMSMCSPARDMNAGYHAVGTIYLEHISIDIWQWGHSMVVDPMLVYCHAELFLKRVLIIYYRGRVLTEAGEGEEIIYADIG